MEIFVLFASMLILIILGVPVGFTVGISCIVTLFFYSEIPLMMITQNCYTGVDSFPLMAIPFFILAGVFMSSGGIAKRLIDAISALFGFITGGLAIVSTLACMFFGAISGSSMAAVSAIGTFMIPEMERKDYGKGFSTALVAAGGTIGVIIPPSIPFVIYGVATNTSIGKLFIAGIIPGIIMALALVTVSYYISKKRGYAGTDKKFNARETVRVIWEAKWAIMAPVIILGGIYGGFFTPTEAAAVAAVYSFVVGMFIYKELTWREVFNSVYKAGVVNAVTLFLIGFATTFATYLTLQQIPATIAQFLIGVTDNKWVLLLLINLLLLCVGAFIDNIPAVLILAPILLPVVQQYGVDPVHFGVMMSLNLAIGFVTPPYGVNLFVATAVSGTPIAEVTKNLIPFLGALLASLFIVTYIPATCMFLVGFMN